MSKTENKDIEEDSKDIYQNEKPLSCTGKLCQAVSPSNVLIFVSICAITFFAMNYYDIKQAEYIKKKPAHCIINSPFDEEIYKYTYWPNYKEFKEKYYGKFEIIEKQMSHPINITFYNQAWL